MARPNARVETAVNVGMNWISRTKDQLFAVGGIVNQTRRLHHDIEKAAINIGLVDSTIVWMESEIATLMLRSDIPPSTRIDLSGLLAQAEYAKNASRVSTVLCQKAVGVARSAHTSANGVVQRQRDLIARERKVLEHTITLGSYERAEEAVSS